MLTRLFFIFLLFFLFYFELCYYSEETPHLLMILSLNFRCEVEGIHFLNKSKGFPRGNRSFLLFLTLWWEHLYWLGSRKGPNNGPLLQQRCLGLLWRTGSCWWRVLFCWDAWEFRRDTGHHSVRTGIYLQGKFDLFCPLLEK